MTRANLHDLFRSVVRSARRKLSASGHDEIIFRSLTVDQLDDHLVVSIETGPGVELRGLWAQPTDGEPVEAAPVVRDGDVIRAEVPLASLVPPLLPQAQHDDTESGYNVHLRAALDRTLDSESAVGQRLAASINVETARHSDGTLTARYLRPLGGAVRSEVGPLHPVRVGEHAVTPYIGERGGVSVAIDRELARFAQVHVARLRTRKGVIKVRGRLHTRHGDLRNAKFVLKGRVSGHRVEAPVIARPDARRTAQRFGLHWYRFRTALDLSEALEQPEFVDDVYDAWVWLDTLQSAEPFEVRVGITRLLTRYRSRAGSARTATEAVAVSPYYTFKARRTSFTIRRFDAAEFVYLRRQVAMRHLLRLAHRRRRIWLIGERPRKAQDNGYWFFRFLREHHPEIEAYYVIERDSPEWVNVAPYGNVVAFGSRQHIHLALLAEMIVGTHHPGFLYPLRTAEFERVLRATKIFLQHGVMGTKWMANLYGRGVGGFDTDLVIVSSEREREYLVTDFGYDLAEVAVTGLPRFDSLFDRDLPVKPRQVVIMPTWRDWLQNRETYPQSEYHETWSALLHDPRLQALVSKYELEVVFCLHSNMEHYRYLFEDTPVTVTTNSEVDIQGLLKQSAMLITDYSSVGFDFSFLHKPVLYFQFDRQQFLGRAGSHLDLDEELPGRIVRSVGSVFVELTARAEADFAMEPAYAARADRFIDHRDRHNCERVLAAITTTKQRSRVLERLKGNEVLAHVPTYLRRHRWYFPVMRRAFQLYKLLPMDRDLVLFESGVGKQYADSPRYLYEELVRDHPHLTKVWAYDGRLPTIDPNTRVIKRLSPRYFYYLARARYWVNNQSFPHYVTRRSDGVYVQTWHGTPLKRMLHDLPAVHGRDAGYVDRATAAAAQWSVLVSPNRYTTDVMRSAFRYRGDVLEVGYPRNDVLHSTDKDKLAARVRARLGIRPDQQVVLYAPTFRDDQGTGRGRFAFTLPFDVARLHAELGPDTVVLLRMHVLVQASLTIPAELRDAVLNVSSHPEISDLYLISDVLITDYSSVFFDYASLDRPILFYAYDLERYRDLIRGFYLEYGDQLPGPVLQTEDQLVDALQNIDEIAGFYAGRRAAFADRYCAMDDGHAAQRAVEAIWGPAPENRAGSS